MKCHSGDVVGVAAALQSLLAFPDVTNYVTMQNTCRVLRVSCADPQHKRRWVKREWDCVWPPDWMQS